MNSYSPNNYGSSRNYSSSNYHHSDANGNLAHGDREPSYDSTKNANGPMLFENLMNVTGNRHKPPLLEDSNATPKAWMRTFSGVTQYEVVWSECVNPHSLREMLGVAQSMGVQVTFRKCTFDLQCCYVLENSELHTCTVVLFECKTQIRIINPLIKQK